MISSSGLFAIHDNVLSIDLNESVYSRDAVLRAAYWFTDRCYLYIARHGSDVFRVHFKPKGLKKSNSVVETLEEIAGEFLNSILDHQLRRDIESQTGQIRQLLVAKAFAEAGVLEDAPPGEVADPVDEAHIRQSNFVQIEPAS
jgi:His-Xaa-Ser system protein HxsD